MERDCQDKLLLIHIFPPQEQIIQTRKDETWLRIGDRTKEVEGLDLRNLEYSKTREDLKMNV